VTAPLLALDSVRYRHGPGSPEAVAGISLQVAAGEVVGLIGPNAAGKSTLARIACGLLRPDSGSVRLRGDDAFTLPRRERARRVAFLSQSEPTDIAFTAREVALMGRAPHLGLWALEAPGDRALAESALAEVDVLDLADRPVTQLSGGERQRVFLARVFAQDAALLVLDEPTAALDLAHQVLLVNAVRRRARDGRGALLVLHDLALAGAACDRLVLVRAGRPLAEGSPAEVLRPDVLGGAYGTQVDVVSDPATGQPLVAPRIVR
jgi:iron complex transport system ATP-binding protein